jgi:hypothetical protein
MLKNILIVILTVAAVIFGLSLWQTDKRAKILVDNLAESAAAAGKWSWSGISNKTDGTVVIRNVRFEPSGFRQGVDIDEIILTLDPLFLLKAKEYELRNYLPNHLNIELNGVRLRQNGPQDFQQALLDRSYWPAVVGYMGAPGCGENGPLAFSMDQWQAMLGGEPVDYHLNFYYQHLGNGEIDFQADTEAQNLWLSSWSGQMKSAVGGDEFAFEDLLLKDLFYYHQDNGFNERRNQVCADRYQGSFAAYRKNSAQTVQNLVRAIAGKELPDKLLNWYQRSLLPEAQFFAEFHLPRTVYLDEIFSMPQKDFLAAGEVLVGLGESEPEAVTLRPISYEKVDSDTFVKAYREEIRKQQAQDKAAEQPAKKKKQAPAKRVIGGKTVRYRTVDDIQQAIGKKARIRTKKGRVIHGVVRQVSDSTVVVQVHYLSGSAEFNLPRKEIESVELQLSR